MPQRNPRRENSTNPAAGTWAPTTRALVAGAAVVAALCIYLSAFRYPMAAILSLLSDDAFYYLEIADNIVRGDGCTFDGIARTNGFHPLWMVLMVVVRLLPGDDPAVPVLVVVALNIAIYAAMLVLVYRTVERFVAPGFGPVAAAACLMPNLLMAMTNGMETGLQLLAVIALIWFCYDRRLLEPGGGRTSAVVLGGLLGVVTLCRLDSVFLFAAALAMTFAGALAARATGRALVGRAAWLCLGFAVPLVPYFAWNLASFGHLTPISSSVKSTFPSLRNDAFVIDGDRRFGAMILVLVLAMNAVVFVADRSRIGGWRALLTSPVVMVTLGCVLHFVHASLFLAWGVYWWHFAVYGLALAISLAKFAHWATGFRRALRVPVVVVSTLLLLAASVAYEARALRIKGRQHRGWLSAAHWARDETPPNTVFAIPDAGLFGYFSERRTVNLDGKANGYEYLQRLMAGDVVGYLEDVGTTYIANTRGRYRDGRYRLGLYRPNRPSVALWVSAEDEVFRSRPIPQSVGRTGAAPETHFFVWRFRPSLAAPTSP